MSGKKILQCKNHCSFLQSLRIILLRSVFAPLTWLDAQSARKCVTIATLLFETVGALQGSLHAVVLLEY